MIQFIGAYNFTEPTSIPLFYTAHFSNKEDDYRIEFAFRGELVVPYLLPV